MPFIILVMVCLVALDQAIKYWAATVLQPLGTIPLIPDVFHLTYLENRGAAFSILMDQRWLFILLASAILIVILYALKKNRIQTKTGQWSLYLIASGAVGNLIDRIVHGYVIDLFDFRWIHFPIFNIADILVCVGGALFAFYILFQHKEKKEHTHE